MNIVDTIKIDDFVRAKVAKTTFGKEGAKYGRDIYLVTEKIGNRYQLINDKEQKIKCLYKGNELQVVDDKKII
jgi:hypothetical protein